MSVVGALGTPVVVKVQRLALRTRERRAHVALLIAVAVVGRGRHCGTVVTLTHATEEVPRTGAVAGVDALAGKLLFDVRDVRLAARRPRFRRPRRVEQLLRARDAVGAVARITIRFETGVAFARAVLFFGTRGGGREGRTLLVDSSREVITSLSDAPCRKCRSSCRDNRRASDRIH